MADAKQSTFAARLRSLIDAGGLSIPELAARSGLSRQHVHALLEGVNTRPSFETVCKLAEALGVDLAAFKSEQPARLCTSTRISP